MRFFPRFKLWATGNCQEFWLDHHCSCYDWSLVLVFRQSFEMALSQYLFSPLFVRRWCCRRRLCQYCIVFWKSKTAFLGWEVFPQSDTIQQGKMVFSPKQVFFYEQANQVDLSFLFLSVGSKTLFKMFCWRGRWVHWVGHRNGKFFCPLSAAQPSIHSLG